MFGHSPLGSRPFASEEYGPYDFTQKVMQFGISEVQSASAAFVRTLRRVASSIAETEALTTKLGTPRRMLSSIAETETLAVTNFTNNRPSVTNAAGTGGSYNQAGFTLSWANTGNILTSDNSNATITAAGSNAKSNLLVASNFGFSFGLLDENFTVEVLIEGKSQGLFSYRTWLTDDAAGDPSTNRTPTSFAVPFTTSDTTITLGTGDPISTIWGDPPNGAIGRDTLNSSSFGVVIYAYYSGTASGYVGSVDQVQVRVTYSTRGLGTREVVANCRQFEHVMNSPNNMLAYSNDFNNAAWEPFSGGSVDPTFTPNTGETLDPFGGYNATKMVAAAGETSSSSIWQLTSTPCVVSEYYTLSVYVKAGNTNSVPTMLIISRNNGALATYVQDISLTTGLGAIYTATGNMVFSSTGSTNVGNGWFRVWLIVTASTTGTLGFNLQFNTTSPTTSTCYLYGASVTKGNSVPAYDETFDYYRTTEWPILVKSMNVSSAIAEEYLLPGALAIPGDTGFQFAPTITQSSYSGGGTAWTSPGNANAADSTYATVTVGAGGISRLLVFPLSTLGVPSTATIQSVSARVYGKSTKTDTVAYMGVVTPSLAFDDGDFLSDGSHLFSTSYGFVTPISNELSFGGMSGSDFNALYGVMLAFGQSASSAVSVDYIQFGCEYISDPVQTDLLLPVERGMSYTITEAELVQFALDVEVSFTLLEFTVDEVTAHILALARERNIALTNAQVEAIAAQVIRNRANSTAVAEVEVLTNALARNRAVVLPVQSTMTYSEFLVRERVTPFTLAETIAYVIAISKGSQIDLTFSVAEAMTYSANFLRARGASITVAELETLGIAVTRALRLQGSISESEVLNTSLARNRGNVFAVAETQTVTAALARLKTVAVAIAETFGYTFSVSKLKALATTITEIETHSFGSLRRTRQAASAINEVLVYAANLLRARGTTLSVAEQEVLNLAIQRTRNVTKTISELEVLNAAVSRRRDVLSTISELETINVSVAKLKMMSYVIAETNNHEFWVNRARNCVVPINELEALQASFNRARAYVLPVHESNEFTIDFNRLREQVLVINETQSLSAALSRLREAVVSIANTTDYVFTLSVYKGDPSSINVTVTWDEFIAISTSESTSTHILKTRSETLRFDLQVSSTQQIVETLSSTLYISEAEASTVLASDTIATTVIVPANTL